MFNRDFDRRVHLTVGTVFLSTVIGVSFCLYALWPANAERGYAPAQPIPYSHKLHAGELQIECLYCHTNAEKHAHAAVPEVRRCMNCHSEVQTVDSQGNIKTNIYYIIEKWQNQDEIRWAKVHDLADFVYFDHSRHVNFGYECQECHGPIETMERVQRWNSLKMSWCLECHRQPPANMAQIAADETHKPETASTANDDKMMLEYYEHYQGPIHCAACHR